MRAPSGEFAAAARLARKPPLTGPERAPVARATSDGVPPQCDNGARSVQAGVKAPPVEGPAPLFARTAYRWPLRPSQQLALEAFERARAAGRRRSYLVLPPGAGKTVLGLEVARRLGHKALVLCPNTADRKSVV